MEKYLSEKWLQEIDRIREDGADIYDELSGNIEDEIRLCESDIKASIIPPNFGIFLPLNKVNREVKEGQKIGKGKFLMAYSCFLGAKERENMDEIDNTVLKTCWELSQKDDLIMPLSRIYSRQGSHESLASFYHNENVICVNRFHNLNLKSSYHEIFDPLLNFITGKDYSKDTIHHEITHAYIYNKCNSYNGNGKDMRAVDEAAAQSVTSLFNSEHLTSPDYANDQINFEVLQAAKNIFQTSVKGMNRQEAISKIRIDAVNYIEDISQGRDPIRVLRNNEDNISKYIRITSYAVKKASKTAIEELAILGIKEDNSKQFYNNIDEIRRVRGDIEKLEQSKKKLDEVKAKNEINSDLESFLTKLSNQVDTIVEVFKKGNYKDTEPNYEVVNEIFGNVWRVDPNEIPEDIEERYLLGLLDYNKDVVEEGIKRARKLSEATKTIHEEEDYILDNSNNEKLLKIIAEIENETEILYNDINSIKSNLEKSEQILVTAIQKIEQ